MFLFYLKKLNHITFHKKHQDLCFDLKVLLSKKKTLLFNSNTYVIRAPFNALTLKCPLWHRVLFAPLRGPLPRDTVVILTATLWGMESPDGDRILLPQRGYRKPSLPTRCCSRHCHPSFHAIMETVLLEKGSSRQKGTGVLSPTAHGDWTLLTTA